MATQVMTDLEQIVLAWLTQHRINFQFQTSLSGGFYEMGGSVVDFILDGNIALRVMGEYWHQGIEKEATDTIQKEQLMATGFIVVDLWGEDLKNRLDETMYKAIQGVEMLY